MRSPSPAWIVLCAWLGISPIAAHADDLSSAKSALKKGDLRSAQIELRNAVRNDPRNAEAHYWLSRVTFELGDPVASEREALAARDRGYDPHQAVPLLATALLAQNKFQALLNTLKPDGKDPALDASILVARGYAQMGLDHPDDARRSFAEAQAAAPNAVEPLLADAKLSLARGNLADTQAKIDKAIAAQPKSPEALLAKGQLLRLKSDVPGATAVLDQLIADQPSLIQARLDRASLELTAGKTDAARADIGVVLKATPGNVEAIYLTAVLDAQTRNYKAADASLERIYAYLGRIKRAYYLQAVVKEQLGQFAQAEEAARRYVGRTPNDLAGYKVLARIQFAMRRPDQVIDALDNVTQSGKADTEAYDLIGRAYAATGQNREAADAFQKAQSLAPNDVGVQTRLAAARISLGDTETAVTDLEHTLALAPKLPAVSEALFFAALGTGDMQKVNEALTKIRAAQRDSDGDNEIVGNLDGLLKLSQIDFAGAKAAFEALVQKYPDFAPARVNLARTDMMLGLPAEAEKQLTTVLARKPTDNAALNMLVSGYVQANRLPDAAAALERAHAADPSATSITVSLGNLYIRAGMPQKALDLARAEKGANATSTEILSLTAAAHLALGQKAEARATYEQILKQDPNAVGMRRQLLALLVDAGAFEAARSVLTQGIAANPSDYQLYLNYALVDLKSAGLDAALATADRLQAQNRGFQAVQALKGDVYLAAKRPTDALAAFQAAYAGMPSILLLTRLAGVMLRMGQTEKATQLLQDWLSRHPDDATATEQLSELQIATGRLGDATASLQAILKRKPHDPVALNNLAWVYQQQGRGDDARALALQAYILSPGAQTADTLGWILVSSGNPRTGLPLLRQARAEGASDPRILYHYAVALNDLGDKDEAKKQLQLIVANQGAFKEMAAVRKLLNDLSNGS